MIPRKLVLRNFMSYGEDIPEVDFTGFSVACLSGQNGHGKSALLDALTWALWGKARAEADSLVRIGASSMSVELEFEIDGHYFRVTRKRTLSRMGSTHTEFQALETDGYSRSLTGQGERDTQAAIESVLRMDYRSFINSALILQGRADEFTQQKPTARKEILAEILDLARFDALEEAARKHQRESDDRTTILNGEIEALRSELSHKPEYQRALEESKQLLAEAHREEESLAAALTELAAESARVEAGVQLLESLRSEEARARREIVAAKQRLAAAQLRLTALDETLSRQQEIERRVTRLQDVRTQLEQMEAAQQIYLAAERDERRLEGDLARVRHTFELRLAQAEERLRETEQKASRAPEIGQRIEALRKAHPPSAELEAQMEELRRAVEERKQQAEGARVGIRMIETQFEALGRRRSLLQEEAAECPLCAQPLTEDRHQRILSDLDRDEQRLLEQIQRFRDEIGEADNEREKIIQEGKALRRTLENSRSADQEIICLERDLAEARAAFSTVPQLQQAQNQLRSWLSRDFAPEIRAALDQARERMERSAYSTDLHQALRDEVRSLEGAEREAADLQNAAAFRKDTLRQMEEARELVTARSGDADGLRQRMAPLEGDARRKQEMDDRRVVLQRNYEQAREKVRTAGDTRGRWTALLSQCTEMEEREKQKLQLLAQAGKDAAIYKDLAAAFSKRGIQAMVIENVIPEIEEEANRLLSGMTDNAMHVRFQTQRELKKGGGAETLDLLISDELGDRPYECYSGGEAFRINFAIRIALSRLLARRAGARLQTIVIDEGFGTQDAQGRQRLIEAIESVRDEFALILVITHLDDIKDEFPARLHVVKAERGSRVTRIG